MTDRTSAPPRSRDVLEAALQLFLEKDLEGFADLFAEDGIHELPFAPPGIPVTLQGREQIRAYLTGITSTPIAFHEFTDLTIHQTDDPDVVIAEYCAVGEIISSGKPFNTRYIQVLQARAGRIATWRDYWSPLPASQALGRLPALFEALTAADRN